jgi:hypothetical protein
MLSTSEQGAIMADNTIAEGGIDEPSVVALRSRWGLRRLSTVGWFGISFLVVALVALLGNVGAPPPLLIALSLFGAALFASATLIALFRALDDAVTLVGWKKVSSPVGTGPAVLLILGNLLMAAFGMFVAYLATFGFSRGRQLRRFGRVLLPGLHTKPEWATCDLALPAPRPNTGRRRRSVA